MSRPADVSALLGRRVRALRKARRLTQEALAERSSVSSKFVGQIERGGANPSLIVLVGIARALEIETWQLLRFEEARPKGPLAHAASETVAAEQISTYLLEQYPNELARALRILEAALGDPPNVQ